MLCVCDVPFAGFCLQIRSAHVGESKSLIMEDRQSKEKEDTASARRAVCFVSVWISNSFCWSLNLSSFHMKSCHSSTNTGNLRHFPMWEGSPFPRVFPYDIQHHELVHQRLCVVPSQLRLGAPFPVFSPMIFNIMSLRIKDNASARRALCFISSDFDPLRALHIEDLQPPDTTVQPLPNLQACISILPMAVETLEELHLTEERNLSEEPAVESLQNPDFKQVSASGLLDFLSPDFDALKALHTKGLAPPNPRVRPLDNLSSCRRILPEEIPESSVNDPPKVPRSAESILAQERAKAHKSTILQKAAERERKITIFDKIAGKLKNGPVGLLAECYQHKLRVKVWTRHTHGVRGSLTGYLLAFDKHVNMVLRDIDEEYSVRRWIPRLVRKRGRSAYHQAVQENDHNDHDQSLHAVNDTSIEIDNERYSSCVHHLADNESGIEEVTDRLKELRLFPKLEHRRRHLKQVFLRGDSVVMVQKLL